MPGEEKGLRVTVIGAGPGGYVAAIRAAQLGADVTIIEKQHLGGVCLNVGCIPTKALLHAAEYLREVKQAQEWGVELQLGAVKFDAVQQKKQKICKQLTSGVAALLKANHVRVIRGEAAFLSPHTLSVQKDDGTAEQLETDRVILATGSVPVMPPIKGLRESKFVVDSTGALGFASVPERLLVIGGGVIGVELACAYRAFGSQVTVVEALPRICAALDEEIGTMLHKELEKQGIRILTGSKVVEVLDGTADAAVAVESDQGREVIHCDKVLAAIGRRSSVEGLNPDAAGIRQEKGRILVDEYLQTNVPGIYAAGDCVGPIMLAHTASAQGEIAAENATGGKIPYCPSSVPSCIYTFPEVACAGLTEEQARKQGISYRVGRFPMSANGRALILNGGVGMVKVIVGEELDEVLGVHIIGPGASELISEANLLITMEGTNQEDILSVHAHPTVSEAVREAFLAADQRAIHTINHRK